MNEQYQWVTMLSTPMFFVNTEEMNLDDLLNADRPGSIIRCYTDPSKAVMCFVSPNDEMLGCIGGMVSDCD